jgi:hypothetical protein
MGYEPGASEHADRHLPGHQADFDAQIGGAAARTDDQNIAARVFFRAFVT